MALAFFCREMSTTLVAFFVTGGFPTGRRPSAEARAHGPGRSPRERTGIYGRADPKPGFTDWGSVKLMHKSH